MDVAKDAGKVRGQIGVCFEQTNLYEQMTALETDFP
jgi:ABC-2 type transport system ATP-binding protein